MGGGEKEGKKTKKKKMGRRVYVYGGEKGVREKK